MPLTLNTGSARPSKGVQPGKKGVRFPQHACTTAGDIIELTGAHSQSLHTVEHGTPPPSAKISESPESCLCPTTAHVTHCSSDKRPQQQQLSRSTTFLSLPSLISRCHSLSAVFSFRCRTFPFSLSAGMQIWFLTG